MLDRGGETRFPLEARTERGLRRELGRQDLESHRAVQRGCPWHGRRPPSRLGRRGRRGGIGRSPSPASAARRDLSDPRPSRDRSRSWTPYGGRALPSRRARGMGSPPDGRRSLHHERPRPSPARRRSRTRDVEMEVIQVDRTLRSTARCAAVVAIVLALSQLGGARVAAAEGFALRVPVLMYHRISAPPPDAAHPQLWVSPARFRAQLRALKAAGWTSITAEELGRAIRDEERVGPKRFVITIDDGARDGWSNAAPILDDLGMRATYCVLPGLAHRPWQLDPRRLRGLHEAGHEIAEPLAHPSGPQAARWRGPSSAGLPRAAADSSLRRPQAADVLLPDGLPRQGRPCDGRGGRQPAGCHDRGGVMAQPVRSARRPARSRQRIGLARAGARQRPALMRAEVRVESQARPRPARSPSGDRLNAIG